MRLTAKHRRIVVKHMGFARRIARSTKARLSTDEKVAAAYFVLCQGVLTWPRTVRFEGYIAHAIQLGIRTDANYQRFARQRKRASQPRWQQIEWREEDRASEGCSPLEVLIRQEESELLREAIKGLSPVLKNVAELVVQGMSVQEIARQTRKPDPVVRYAMMKIRARLREVMA